MARSLQDYIQIIRTDGKLFSNKSPHRPLELRQNTANRILLYPGSFNPPHRGHFALLQHVFENAPADLNLIAAIIWPLSDEGVADKKEDRMDEDAMILTREERVQLWVEHGLRDYMWVYEGSPFTSSIAQWASLKSQLANVLGSDGFELEFCCLLGPDLIDGFDAWYCRDILTSDAGREWEIVTSGGGIPTQLDGYNPWTSWERPETNIRRPAQNSGDGKRGGQARVTGLDVLQNRKPVFHAHIHTKAQRQQEDDRDQLDFDLEADQARFNRRAPGNRSVTCELGVGACYFRQENSLWAMVIPTASDSDVCNSIIIRAEAHQPKGTCNVHENRLVYDLICWVIGMSEHAQEKVTFYAEASQFGGAEGKRSTHSVWTLASRDIRDDDFFLD
ncbi:uncharacterized protein DSM5745_03875 [Aspergillus mulundensis]|uniref:Cytidyltransferase-like domain-containing protein n=1 Tax=Aspergillus mulundensis TaxID=1810919 RepID=A0A3D8SB11_9EURO|nr:hypothetical protein DSM5745_03875 [Aspergillus mulundensis]RDW83549.1 hypothetical protein DSM5745_03875 [Aspergillus mulundensis]